MRFFSNFRSLLSRLRHELVGPAYSAFLTLLVGHFLAQKIAVLISFFFCPRRSAVFNCGLVGSGVSERHFYPSAPLLSDIRVFPRQNIAGAFLVSRLLGKVRNSIATLGVIHQRPVWIATDKVDQINLDLDRHFSGKTLGQFY